jgi:hypothetical protein
MVDDLKFWGTYALLVAIVLLVGWRQPLQYRFMSKKEIAEYESPSITPTPAPTPWNLDSKRSTKLDQGPYKDRTGRRTYFYQR